MSILIYILVYDDDDGGDGVDAFEIKRETSKNESNLKKKVWSC